MLPWQQHFEGHVLLKFEFLTCFVDLIGLLCWGSSILVTYEHYNFEKNDVSDFFSRSVTSLMTSYKYVQIVSWSGKWRQNSWFLTFWIFLRPVLMLFEIILEPIYWNSLKIDTKLTSNWYVTSTTCPTSRFLIHVSLNPKLSLTIQDIWCDWNGLKSEFAVWRIDQVFLIKSTRLCWPLSAHRIRRKF